ncbi:MAG: STAS-like domain-containing protein [Dysgonamonadaceae bacterium]|jgi:hypothetical protein|nr:STAS-like domain-containing protein [Dysgonamonadaceae bacterium]
MKNQTIIVKNICKGTFTNADGVALYCAIVRILDASGVVVLSFNEIDAVSSSFLNSSIGNIIDERGIDTLRNQIKITHYTPTLAAVVKKYIASYSLLVV